MKGWGEVDRGRKSISVIFGRPDGFRSSDFAQIVDLFMFYRFMWASGVEFMKSLDFWAEEGSNFDDVSSENIGWDIDVFASAKRGDSEMSRASSTTGASG